MGETSFSSLGSLGWIPDQPSRHRYVAGRENENSDEKTCFEIVIVAIMAARAHLVRNPVPDKRATPWHGEGR